MGVPRDVLGHLVDAGIRRADPVALVDIDRLGAPRFQPQSVRFDGLGEHVARVAGAPKNATGGPRLGHTPDTGVRTFVEILRELHSYISYLMLKSSV
ncbi:hypothetical protein BN903_143 [Halorubrum sp. AJ67]|nr:hypothetical protein BN903_143 [Halorubrum sp. AJ67]